MMQGTGGFSDRSLAVSQLAHPLLHPLSEIQELFGI